jgi:predicted transcriptional regulator
VPGYYLNVARKATHRARGELEQEVLACLAASAAPMTPAEVQGEIGRRLAYTTILTTLTRLHSKGALNRVPDGRTYRYWLPGGLDEARTTMTARRMLQLLPDGADRRAVLAHFVGELDQGDEKTLAMLLAEAERAAPRSRSER